MPNDLGITNVKDFGAIGDGLANDTTAIQNAINSSAGNIFVYFPRGAYRVTTTILIANDRTHLLGGGKWVSQIKFEPVSAGLPLFEFSKGTSVLYQCSLRKLSIYSPDTARHKIAIRISDNSEMVVEDITIGPVGQWTGNDSIGLQIRGREFGTVNRISNASDLPISIEKNENFSIGLDHWHFSDIYLVPSNNNPNIRIESGVNLTSIVMDGYNGWVGGSYGLFFDDNETTATADQITIRNTRWEQSTNGTGYMIFIKMKAGLRNLLLDGLSCGTRAAHRGFFLRKVQRVMLQNCAFKGNAAEALNAENVNSLQLQNTFFIGGSTISLPTLRRVLAYGRPPDATEPTFPNEMWEQADNVMSSYGLNVYGVQRYAEKGTVKRGLANKIDIPLGQGSHVAAMIQVFARGATKNEGGTVLVTSGGAFLLNGTPGFGVGNVPNKLTVFFESPAKVSLTNQLNEEVRYGYDLSWR
jgi:hypothetical protein